MAILGAVVAVLVVLLGGPLSYALHTLLSKWKRAQRVRRIFEAQGIKCLPRSFLSGNMREFAAIQAKARARPMTELSHATAPRVLPHIFVWSRTYGDHFTYWFGFQPRYVLRDPDQAKELLSTKSGHFTKVEGTPETTDLIGRGLPTLDGEKWVQRRRLVNPAFFADKLKAMAPLMATLTVDMTKKWASRIEGNEPIDVSEEFRNLSADIIAHTAFGSSFAEAKIAFELQHEQQELISRRPPSLRILSSRFLPTATNRYRASLMKRIHAVLGQIIQKRLTLQDGYGDDLLGLMLTANNGLHGDQNTFSMGLNELIDECQSFFFAGHDTTATLLIFLFMLLAIHPEWQVRLREEIFEVCEKTQLPIVESLNGLKLAGMVINEALRLYSPAPYAIRMANNDIKLGEVLVPASTAIVVPIMAWHQDERFWGPDATKFRPERFEEGVLKACKVPGTYLPFSYGPRSCIGQGFVIIQAKMVLAAILQRYHFSLSPHYAHGPTTAFTLRPQFGMPILFEKIP